MALLSNVDIERELQQGRLIISPFLDELMEPAGYTLRLAGPILRERKNGVIDPEKEEQPDYEKFELSDSGWVLAPGDLVLATTLEKLTIPDDLLCRIEGRSTIGRRGLHAHQCAMNVWPGHGLTLEGPVPRPIVLEISNSGARPFLLKTGLKIAQITLERLETPTTLIYDERGRYGKSPSAQAVFKKREVIPV